MSRTRADLTELTDLAATDEPQCTAALVDGYRDPATCDGCPECVAALVDELEIVASLHFA